MTEPWSDERAVVERAGQSQCLTRFCRWAAVDGDSRNLGGLERMADLFVDAFAACRPGVTPPRTYHDRRHD